MMAWKIISGPKQLELSGGGKFHTCIAEHPTPRGSIRYAAAADYHRRSARFLVSRRSGRQFSRVRVEDGFDVAERERGGLRKLRCATRLNEGQGNVSESAAKEVARKATPASDWHAQCATAV